ncbi:thioesterase II family protein [Microbulbifer litoralis]|uniref:thioesterase II family protein n=1 Tax=Microbulbifer litoralis TaxID=2933965 RepID=UPI002027A5FE|nr:alpha/beta fold hydrolase [Microbulbifer sp. GX H0434]
MQLFCLPYAGGGATGFHSLREHVAGEIELHVLSLPGREQRFSEPPIDRLMPMLDCLQAQLQQSVTGPYALYGHSMGALLAFELAHRQMAGAGPRPQHLFVAARGAPALDGEYERYSHLPDREFLERIGRFGGLHPAIFDTPELLQLVLPILRADFRLLDRYQYLPRPPLQIPITSLHGADDPGVREDWVRAWQSETSTDYRHHRLRGGHFFLAEAAAELSAVIGDTLKNRPQQYREQQPAALPDEASISSY